MTRRSPAQYDWSKQQFDERILSKHITSPRRSKVAFVVAHHSTMRGRGDGKVNSEMYNVWQNRQASAHYGVDGDYVMQFVWDKNAAWSTANSNGNHAGISIEHANSSLGPKWTISERTWKNGARLAAHLHVTHKLGRPVGGKTMRRHSDFFATACPGPFMASIWSQYVKEAQAEYDRITKSPAPKPPPMPKPTKKPKTLFRFGQWSLAGFDVVYGQKNWDKTVDGVVKEMARLKARVWSVTEVPGPKVKSFDAKLRKRGLKVVISNNGRTIIAEQDVKVGRIKAVTLKEKGPANDDKQIVLAELWPDGQHAWVIECGHYEYRNGAVYDRARVTQGKQAKAATLAFAKDCGIPSSRIIFGDDENSASWVLEQAFAPGFVDAVDAAYKPTNKVYATIVGWLGKTPKGSRTDRIKVHAKRPVAAARVSAVTAKRKVTDHVPTIADIGTF